MVETRHVEVEGRKVFDLRVEIREPKTGKIEKYQPYTMHVNRDGTLYESPPGSGKFFDGQGTLAKDISAELKAKYPERYVENKAGDELAKLKAENDKLKEQLAAKDEKEPEGAELDPVASAEAEANAIMNGKRNTNRSAVRTSQKEE